MQTKRNNRLEVKIDPTISTTEGAYLSFSSTSCGRQETEAGSNDYKYVSPSKTILERLFLIDYWMALSIYPTWLALMLSR